MTNFMSTPESTRTVIYEGLRQGLTFEEIAANLAVSIEVVKFEAGSDNGQMATMTAQLTRRLEQGEPAAALALEFRLTRKEFRRLTQYHLNEKVKTMFAAGKPIKEIATATGLAIPTVYLWAKAAGVERPPADPTIKTKRTPNPNKSKVLNDYENTTKPLTLIAKEYGVSVPTIHNWARAAGLYRMRGFRPSTLPAPPSPSHFQWRLM